MAPVLMERETELKEGNRAEGSEGKKLHMIRGSEWDKEKREEDSK